MTTDHDPAARLVRMADQIAGFFATQSDPQAAAAQIAEHLRRFWAPAMRTQLLDHAAAVGDAALPPAVAAALRLLRKPAA